MKSSHFQSTILISPGAGGSAVSSDTPIVRPPCCTLMVTHWKKRLKVARSIVSRVNTWSVSFFKGAVCASDRRHRQRCWKKAAALWPRQPGRRQEDRKVCHRLAQTTKASSHLSAPNCRYAPLDRKGRTKVAKLLPRKWGLTPDNRCPGVAIALNRSAAIPVEPSDHR